MSENCNICQKRLRNCRELPRAEKMMEFGFYFEPSSFKIKFNKNGQLDNFSFCSLVISNSNTFLQFYVFILLWPILSIFQCFCSTLNTPQCFHFHDMCPHLLRNSTKRLVTGLSLITRLIEMSQWPRTQGDKWASVHFFFSSKVFFYVWRFNPQTVHFFAQLFTINLCAGAAKWQGRWNGWASGTAQGANIQISKICFESMILNSLNTSKKRTLKGVRKCLHICFVEVGVVEDNQNSPKL